MLNETALTKSKIKIKFFFQKDIKHHFFYVFSTSIITWHGIHTRDVIRVIALPPKILPRKFKMAAAFLKEKMAQHSHTEVDKTKRKIKDC